MYPSKAATISLAPANVRKAGTVLGAMGTVRPCGDTLLAGELSLDDGLQPGRGVLGMAVCARKSGVPSVVVPKENAAEAVQYPSLDREDWK